MGEPLETTEALLGVVGRGGRFILKGSVAEDGYGDVSIPGNPGRLDGKGGVWRDMVSRCGRLGRHQVHYFLTRARLLCNNIDIAAAKRACATYARPVNREHRPLS